MATVERETEAAPTEADLVALARRLQAEFVRRGRTLATAESCTGGLIAHIITEVSGSSRYLHGGVVAYSNAIKRTELGVSDAILEAHGAVSAQAARSMAEGARRRLGTDVAVSVTGVAGPDGGSATKPVGLTYIGVADASGADVRRFVWPFDRGGNKRASAAAALTMLLERADG